MNKDFGLMTNGGSRLDDVEVSQNNENCHEGAEENIDVHEDMSNEENSAINNDEVQEELIATLGETLVANSEVDPEVQEGMVAVSQGIEQNVNEDDMNVNDEESSNQNIDP